MVLRRSDPGRAPAPSPATPQTEAVSPRYLDLDAWPSGEALEAMLEGQMAAAAAVKPALETLAEAADRAAERLGASGRLVYAGAGTSGRIGVQDGVELTPTFNWPPERTLFALAGGEAALVRSVENAEDDAAAGAARIAELGIGLADVVIGVAASGQTPYTVAAVTAAGERGALTIGVANSAGSALLSAARHPILLATGAEAVAGSTRMKAGTAQKIALNLLSTQIMIRLGRVYRGQMVHMRATNEKLRRRGERMVQRIVGCTAEAAQAAFEASGGDVKVALLVANGLAPEEARRLLARHGEDVRAALGEATYGMPDEDWAGA